MSDSTAAKPIEPLQIQIIAAVFTASIVVLMVLPYLTQSKEELQKYDPSLHGLILGGGVLALIGSLFIEKILIRKLILKDRVVTKNNGTK